MGKRMPVEIVAEILDRCLEENPKTRIMYLSNLSFGGITKYLAWLTSSGLLQKDLLTRKYQTTTKGKKLLSCWSETCKLLQIEKQNKTKWMTPQIASATRFKLPTMRNASISSFIVPKGSLTEKL